jgi:myo-inositol-1(or 4)-monophosphatase
MDQEPTGGATNLRKVDDENVLELLGIAERAARAGGEIARARLGDPGYLRWTADRDLLTGAGQEVEDAIVRLLHQECPSSAIVGSSSAEETNGSLSWLIKPISGSLSFWRGVPIVASSIGCRGPGGYLAAAVYDPNRDEMFTAAAAQGAKLNGRALAVATATDVGPRESRSALRDALIGTDWPTHAEYRGEHLALTNGLASRTRALYVLGSPVLGLCYVAAGRLDAYYHLALRDAEVAAAGLILREAGAVFTDRQGASWLYSHGDYAASAGALHDALLERLAMSVMPADHT